MLQNRNSILGTFQESPKMEGNKYSNWETFLKLIKRTKSNVIFLNF